MGHTSDGVLRRLLDEPAGVADTDREHAAGCPRCLAALAAMRADAVIVGAALAGNLGATGGGPGEVDGLDEEAAWRRLVAAMPAAGTDPAAGHARTRPQTGPLSARRPRLGSSARRPVVAALVAVAVLAGAGTAAANGWLQIFRTERVAVIGLSTADLVALPDLRAYGQVEVSQEADLREVDNAADAARRTGLDLPDIGRPPTGVDGEPRYQVSDQVEGVFTFSAQRAAQAAAAAGEALPPVPPGLDGTRVRLVAGPGVARVWPSAAGMPALIVGRAVAPKAFSSDVPFETVRDYMLSLPGLPDHVARQLRAFTADGATLPLPVPTDDVTTTTVDLDGVQATALASRDGSFAAVVWVDEGVLSVVGGSLSTKELLPIAGKLR
ncbi:hypothetical protein UG55_11153 [Frankia sp. EI5c]|uniref:hypothetical protein n=1 Tax=Frankia sp. EI5c TaxID=683316 RepID=UPI0007C207CA|nr:hypothetical protein [Frankia sp. EI5c]OAA18325.1 hypothetical protein UG55_11153 [Frankia sp. EI5c]